MFTQENYPNTMLTNFNYNGKVIAQREDGFINLTQMCEVNKKRLDKFMKAVKTQDYITALERSHQMGVTDIVQGGIPENQGTWGHPSLAINLARWISVYLEFGEAGLDKLLETEVV